MKSFWKFLTLTPLLACLAFAASLSSAQTPHTARSVLPQASPPAAVVTRLGFSPERLARMDRIYQEKVARGEMPGIVILIARHGQVVHRSAIGYANIEKKQPMTPDTIFPLYSMSKSVASTALMMLYEEGKFRIDDPISKYLPEFANLRVLRDKTSPVTDTAPLQREPTIHDLYLHTAGFRHGAEPNAVDLEYLKQEVISPNTSLAEEIVRLGKIPLFYQPGAETIYSLAPDVEARLVEVLSGMSYDKFLETRLFAPLQMKDTAFWFQGDKAERLATLYWHDENDRLVPLDDAHVPPEPHPHSEQPVAFHAYTRPHARTGGAVGLASTADDYWHFAQMLLNRGVFRDQRVLGAQTVDYMTRSHKGVYGLGFTIVNDPAASGAINSPGSYGWGGLNCHAFWVDPKLDMVVVALSHQTRNTEPFGLFLRPLVYAALLE